MSIESQARERGLSSEELFEVAYRSCSGCIWGLRKPSELHDLWKRGLCELPPYVVAFLKKPFFAETDQLLLI